MKGMTARNQKLNALPKKIIIEKMDDLASGEWCSHFLP